MIKRETYLKRIRPFVGTDLIKVLSGIRRSGKSVLLGQIMDELRSSGIKNENLISINFENLQYANLLNAAKLHQEILNLVKNKKGKVYLFFDEIQEVSDWEKCINSFRVEFNCDIYITGSNSKLLSGELATYLAGRYVEFVVYPFSFAEFTELYRLVDERSSLEQCFEKYLTVGGMPYLVNIKYEPAAVKQYLQDLFNSVQLKDIVSRHKINNVDLLERIIAYVMINAGTVFSSSSLVKFLKNERRSTSGETVLNYIKYCCESYLFYRVKRESLIGKRVIATNEKYYIADHGLREAIFGGNMSNIHLILENIVYLEMLRRGYQVTVGKVGEQEIDFIGKKSNQKIYIQVSYILADDSTVKREFGVYSKISDNFPKYVVSMDRVDMSRDGIKHRNIIDFLMTQAWD